jgi:hypothetical protein
MVGNFEAGGFIRFAQFAHIPARFARWVRAAFRGAPQAVGAAGQAFATAPRGCGRGTAAQFSQVFREAKKLFCSQTFLFGGLVD